jgi:hypothetical protein
LSLCIVGAATLRIAASAFTLSWLHSVQHSRWEEDWAIADGRLVAIEARIESMGAGMEAGPDAVFDGTWWRWKPKLPPLPEMLLRRSDSQPQGWRLCANGACRAVADANERADVVALRPCE